MLFTWTMNLTRRRMGKKDGKAGASEEVIPDSPEYAGARQAWGSMRIRLKRGNGHDTGDYIHGKLLPLDYTHGCICDKDEKVLRILKIIADQHKERGRDYKVPVWIYKKD